MLTIRRATPDDAESLLDLYFRHLTKYPPTEEQDITKWRAMLKKFAADPLYHVLVGEADGRVVSSVTLIIIENLTHNQRPYALIENVVTHCEFRGQHFATALMEKASSIAADAGCYKIMLFTGSRKDSTLRFYENCGFSREGKTGFLKRL
ncbi:MAG: GNAT family N-acetyltransferase [Clostridia bacterium]|nr:GNAT family N-acetyltransferase [Clostridia bacterium]